MHMRPTAMVTCWIRLYRDSHLSRKKPPRLRRAGWCFVSRTWMLTVSMHIRALAQTQTTRSTSASSCWGDISTVSKQIFPLGVLLFQRSTWIEPRVPSSTAPVCVRSQRGRFDARIIKFTAELGGIVVTTDVAVSELLFVA